MNTLIESQKESITLYYREGSSDKIYQCAIEPAGELFVVNFAYGRRGATLNTGTKTSTPVDYQTAKNTFDKLVREKTAKGYTPGPDGTPYENTPKAGQVTGILPQLLNPIEEAELARFIQDPAFCAQEKYDGQRRLLQKQGAAIHGINRRGLLCGFPSLIIHAAMKLPGDFILDGECIGDMLHAFDLLSLNGVDVRARSYRERYRLLLDLICNRDQEPIGLTTVLTTAKEKAGLLRDLKELRREGIVFKRLDAPYTSGRPASGGDQYKHKFTATLSAVVAKINAQRSVELRLIGKIGWQTAGNVTIPANQSIPQVGEVVEVRYLYAFPQSGVLYQPVYLGRRTDIDPAECMVIQLKYKADDAEES